MQKGKAFVWLMIWATNIVLLAQVHHLPSSRLHMYVFDVGQGDAILLTTPSGKHILIDGGPDLSLLEHLGRTMPFFNRTIDLLIITHPNTDHLFAIPFLLQHYHVRAALLSPAPSSLPTYGSILQALLQKKIPILSPSPGTDIRFRDGVLLDILWPPRTTHKNWEEDANNSSIVLRAIYGNQRILLTGDIEEKAEMAILASGTNIQSTILKVAHHGSQTSTSTGFLLASSPQSAIISVGRNNRYKHPHPNVLSRLLHFGIRTTTTAENGTVLGGFYGFLWP